MTSSWVTAMMPKPRPAASISQPTAFRGYRAAIRAPIVAQANANSATDPRR